MVHHLPKEYKFSLGQDIIERTWKLLDLFIEAQSVRNPNTQNAKVEIVKTISLQFDSLKLRIRFLTELKLISIGQSATLTENVGEIGKMIGSWMKNA